MDVEALSCSETVQSDPSTPPSPAAVKPGRKSAADVGDSDPSRPAPTRPPPFLRALDAAFESRSR